MGNLTPDSPVRYVTGIGPDRASELSDLGIETARDLIFHLPRRYVRRSNVDDIAEVLSHRDDSDEVVVEGTIRQVQKRKTRSGKMMVTATISDRTGRLDATWFNMEYLADKLERGTSIRLSGEPEFERGSISMTHPNFDYPLDEDEENEPAPLLPVYPLTEGISQNLLRKSIPNALDELLPQIKTILPDWLREKRDVLPLPDALRAIHQPDEDTGEEGKRTVIYYRAFLYFLALQSKRDETLKDRSPYDIDVTERIDQRIRERFPFDLTDAQNRVIDEITADFHGDHVMYRLLQGDVGSGKTVVALYAMLSAIAGGYQTAMMAPTSVLAEQHYHTIDSYLSNSDVTYRLLTGSATGTERDQIYEELRDGSIDLIIGTHALLEDPVQFDDLALVVMDEQQRFGVRHRTQLVSKGTNPHILVTTATPIPRSLALTVYGDLDISVIDEMPPGRQPVKTVVRPRSKLKPACDFIREKIDEGRQAFFVYPLVEESEELPLVPAEDMHERLNEELYPDLTVGLLHGQMKEDRKREIMDAFRNNDIQVLVSTVIIEVGVDVPNATIMVIDHAERYGLSQLHQLRGRIGRGEHQSYCILLSDRQGEVARERLRIFEQTNDGFDIAEEDLRLRGPGTLLGTRQSGVPELDLLKLSTDTRLLSEARDDAAQLLEQDPDLNQHPELKRKMNQHYGEQEDLLRSG